MSRHHYPSRKTRINRAREAGIRSGLACEPFQDDLPTLLRQAAKKGAHQLKLSLAPDRVIRSRGQTEYDAQLMLRAAAEIERLRGVIAEMESEGLTECARESGVEVVV